jgi:hypothetical protein
LGLCPRAFVSSLWALGPWLNINSQSGVEAAKAAPISAYSGWIKVAIPPGLPGQGPLQPLRYGCAVLLDRAQRGGRGFPMQGHSCGLPCRASQDESETMSYSWVITKDHITDPGHDTNDAGIFGPSGCALTPEEIRNHPEGKAFQMKDGDGQLYYEGLYVGPDDERLFGPIHDFGTPNAGCVEIYYQDESGQWELL